MKVRKKDEKVTNVIFVLDSSGSMAAYSDMAINSFNEQIGALKSNKEKLGRTTVSLVLFGHDPATTQGNRHFHGRGDVALVYDCVSLEKIKPLTRETYRPMGMTPMYDGISFGASVIEGLDEPDAANLMIVITDGAENNSIYTTKATMAQIIKDLRASGRWTIQIMGANINLEDAKEIMLGDCYTAFMPTPQGWAGSSRCMSAGISNYSESRMRGVAGASLDISNPDPNWTLSLGADVKTDGTTTTSKTS
jgi:hypothetical protein